jgi:hypothetical protein
MGAGGASASPGFLEKLEKKEIYSYFYYLFFFLLTLGQTTKIVLNGLNVSF